MADYAFIIGLEDYISNDLPSVQFAENDANEIAASLEQLGFTVDTLLLSKAATKTTIEHPECTEGWDAARLPPLSPLSA